MVLGPQARDTQGVALVARIARLADAFQLQTVSCQQTLGQSSDLFLFAVMDIPSETWGSLGSITTLGSNWTIITACPKILSP